MGKRVGLSRTSFEGKLCKLLMAENRNWFALTSGNNQGWDVHLYRPTNQSHWSDVILIEVKTSVKQSITFSGTQFDQLKRYRDIWKEHRIPTFYAFRWITSIKKYNGKPFDVLDKWHFFHINDVGKTLKWERGVKWKTFLKWLK